jgi:hypothetical protein
VAVVAVVDGVAVVAVVALGDEAVAESALEAPVAAGVVVALAVDAAALALTAWVDPAELVAAETAMTEPMPRKPVKLIAAVRIRARRAGWPERERRVGWG